MNQIIEIKKKKKYFKCVKQNKKKEKTNKKMCVNQNKNKKNKKYKETFKMRQTKSLIKNIKNDFFLFVWKSSQFNSIGWQRKEKNKLTSYTTSNYMVEKKHEKTYNLFQAALKYYL